MAAAEELEPLEPEPEEPAEGEESENEAPALVLSEEDPNLVAAIELAEGEDSETLKKIREKVIRDFEADWDRNEDVRARFAENWKLFTGDLPEKTFPSPDAANANVPAFIENMARMSFRVYDEIFGDWSEVFGVLPLGPTADPDADILTLHGNWQFRDQFPEFAASQARSVLLFFFDGQTVGHSYWDPMRRRNMHDTLTPEEFVMPYAYTAIMPDLSDLPHYSRILKTHRHQLQQMRDHYEHVDDLLKDRKPSWDDEPDQSIARVGAEVNAEDEPDDDQGAPYKLIWYEGWLELPGHSRDRWCKVILDKDSGYVLQLTIFEEPNWQDKIRYEREMMELEQYNQSLARYQEQSMMLEQQTMELTQAAEMGAIDPMMASQGLEALTQQVVPMPEPPAWMETEDTTPEPPRWEPIRLFYKANCIEPLAGAKGLGYGQMMADYTIAANTTLNQFIDSATLDNCPVILTAGDIDFPKGFTWTPGKIAKLVGVSSEEMKNGIMPMRPGGANSQLLEATKLFHQYASQAGQTPDVLSGASGKSGESFRGLATRIEQATKMMSVPARAYTRHLENLYKANAYLNSVFLPEDELIAISNHRLLSTREVRVSRKMYERNYKVAFRGDLRFTSQQQRVNEATEVLQLPQAVPPLQMNLAFWHASTMKALKARGMEDLAATLGPPPPAPTTPFGLPPPMPPGPPGAPPPPGAPSPPGAAPPPGAPPPGGPPSAPAPSPAGPGGGGTIPQGPPV